MSKPIILTGDRPTGKLHIGHYVGSLKRRVQMQNEGIYDTFIMMADQQALTDHAKEPQKKSSNLLVTLHSTTLQAELTQKNQRFSSRVKSQNLVN